ncbi:MAG: LptF/LptG family permease [Gemmatimonadetes bacterium]|nr:LptF/LptG family permease [Gemmatimonadota bacterium]
MKITSKYILKEHVGPLVFALSALTSLLLLNYVAKKFGDLVGKGLPVRAIVEFFALSIPFTIAMTLPMAILVATLHAFSRLASENEITAYKASGVSMHRLVAPVLVAAMGFTVFMIWFNDQVLPRTNHQLATLTGDISRKKPTVAFKEQIINEVSPGKLYLKAVHIDRATSMMRDVTIYDLSPPQKRRAIHADSGLLELSPDQVDLLLTLYSGSMTEVSLQEPGRLQRNFFRTDFIKVRGVGNNFENESPDSAYKSDREMTVCELQDRVGRSARTRDSTWKMLYRYDRKFALTVQPTVFRPGLGAWYCRALTAVGIKTAAAATVPQDTVKKPATVTTAPPQDTTKKPATAIAAPPQDTAKSPAPATAAPQDSAALAAPTPPSMPHPAGMPPNYGQVVASGDSLSGSTSQILAEGLKIEFGNAANVVDRYSVEIEKKFAIAVACFVFVLLGAPIALRFPRGGVGMTIGVSLAVFGLYYVGLIVGETMADRDYMTPFWSMWTANIILGMIGLVLMVRLGREGTTNRGSETTELLDRARRRVARLVRRRHR